MWIVIGIFLTGINAGLLSAKIDGQVSTSRRGGSDIHDIDLASRDKSTLPPNKDQDTLSRNPRRWDVHHQIPQTLQKMTETVVAATKAIMDPYKILEMVVRSIPESLRVMGWYLALTVTFLWCVTVLVIGGFVTCQAFKMLFTVSRQIGTGLRVCTVCLYRSRCKRFKTKKPIVKI